ncbi:MAG: DUF3857 domain-containing protein [Acidobacteriota bacterium]|nr:MAG: DUF3857 domain-containing protein [Acidobacteriota bacterium]
MIPRLISIPLALLLFAAVASAQANGWRPVSPEEFSSNTALVEKNADAEVIFWDVRVEDQYVPKTGFRTNLDHYIRIKIFSDRGREDNAKVEIPYGNLTSLDARVEISEIAARTTKRDGTIINLKQEDIFDQEVVSGAGISLQTKSFVIPGIEAGSVVEYRWREVRRDSLTFFERLQVARDVPIREVKYYLKPVSAPGFNLSMRVRAFNTTAEAVKEAGGFYSLTFYDVPAYVEEPFMPPEDAVRPWLLVYYAGSEMSNDVPRSQYWGRVNLRTLESHRSTFKKRKSISKTTERVVGDATSPVEKLRRIYAYCNKSIRNLSDDALGLSREEREELKENKNASDTLKRRQGYSYEINHLFLAMARAAGFDARLAMSSSRTNPTFDKSFLSAFLLDSEIVAVKLDGEWKYFDPSLQHLPFGMLSWELEGQEVLIADEDTPEWNRIPASRPERSRVTRTLRLRLDADGGISGTADIEFTGHSAAAIAETLDNMTPEEREAEAKEYAVSRIGSSAAVNRVTIENLREPEKPLVYRFDFTVPDYCESSSRRLFLRPNVFSSDTKPVFTSGSRRNDIFFRYAWSEKDTVQIEIPEGFEIETAGDPVSVADAGHTGSYSGRIGFDASSRTLTYSRTFSFGQSGKLQFEATSYSRLKDLFDGVHSADQKAVTLVRSGAL